MFGIDLGLNVGSVTLVVKKQDIDHHVLKFSDEKSLDWLERVDAISSRYIDTILGITERHSAKKNISIEEPIYSWGRKNPKAFAKNVALFILVATRLKSLGFKIIPVNNKTAKRIAGAGDNTKEDMIKAYIKATGMEPGHSTQYGKETLADSFFIAIAGLEAK